MAARTNISVTDTPSSYGMALHGVADTISVKTVQLAFAFKQLNVPFREINSSSSNSSRENGPLLALPEGRQVYGTVSIIDYVEDRFAAHPLLPIGAYVRAQCRQLTETLVT
ncbi:MAG: hypothetical protein AAF723_09695, partial [Pseudomonadota bacterium]